MHPDGVIHLILSFSEDWWMSKRTNEFRHIHRLSQIPRPVLVRLLHWRKFAVEMKVSIFKIYVLSYSELINEGIHDGDLQPQYFTLDVYLADKKNWVVIRNISYNRSKWSDSIAYFYPATL